MFNIFIFLFKDMLFGLLEQKYMKNFIFYKIDLFKIIINTIYII